MSYTVAFSCYIYYFLSGVHEYGAIGGFGALNCLHAALLLLKL
jgi:hypothetical protein